jgi:hypothetical protein
MRVRRFLIFIPPKDFKDESISLIKLFFDKWDVKYDITSYTSSTCIGSHGATYSPDIHTAKVAWQEYDGIVLIDGNGIESYKLYDYRPLLDIMLNFNNAKRYIIAIDGSVKIPARANIIRDRKLAMSTEDKETMRLVTLFHGIPSDEELELSGNLITIKSSSGIEDSFPKVLEHIGVA